jgi:hypothetical protein
VAQPTFDWLWQGAEKVFRAETQAEPPAPPQQIKNLQRFRAGGSACTDFFIVLLQARTLFADHWNMPFSISTSGLMTVAANLSDSRYYDYFRLPV